MTSAPNVEPDGHDSLLDAPAGPGGPWSPVGPCGPGGPAGPRSPVATLTVTVFVGVGVPAPKTAATPRPPAAANIAPASASRSVLLFIGSSLLQMCPAIEDVVYSLAVFVFHEAAHPYPVQRLREILGLQPRGAQPANALLVRLVLRL